MSRTKNIFLQAIKITPVGLFVLASYAHAAPDLDFKQDLAKSTYLIEITQNTALSLKTRGLRHGGFETAKGEWVGFDRWYSTKWNDTRISWLTQVNQNFGLIWGVSSGERAKKYRIDPGLRLGFLFQTTAGKNSVLSLSGSTMLGGQLREKSCTADYGDIGGIQKVNCRLAASVLQPSETLSYLYNEKPESALKIQYKLLFE